MSVNNISRLSAKTVLYIEIFLVAFIEISRIFNSRFQSDASENIQATFFSSTKFMDFLNSI